MIDGWRKEVIVDRLKTHSVEYRGAYTFKEALQLLEMDEELFLPTSDELVRMYEDDMLDLSPDCYWDDDTIMDEEYRDSYYELVVLRREK